MPEGFDVDACRPPEGCIWALPEASGKSLSLAVKDDAWYAGSPVSISCS